MKSFRSAVVVIPPESCWMPIQEIRRLHDSHFHRWMPHITLLYPFRAEEEHAAVRPALHRAAATQSAFELTLTTFRTFPQGRDRHTLWLAPEPSAPLASLVAALLRVFPDCDDTSRYRSGFTPHLSVGQTSSRELTELRERLQNGWSPLRFRVTEIATIVRPKDGPFEILDRIQLA